jgi:hypothetical protein
LDRHREGKENKKRKNQSFGHSNFQGVIQGSQVTRLQLFHRGFVYLGTGGQG